MNTQTTPAPAREARKQKREDATRRLLDEGLKLIARKGLHACKVEEITKAAGVGKGTFFTHFASKEAFVARLVDQVLSDLARRVRPVGLMPTEAEALLAGVGGVHLRYFQLRPEAAALISQACVLVEDGESGQQIRARLLEHLEMVGGLVAPAAEPLGWPRDRVGDLALMLLATSCGYYWFSWTLAVGQDTPVALLDRLGRVLARGLAGPRAETPAAPGHKG
jgi:AcrR family transcriptional regulator